MSLSTCALSPFILVGEFSGPRMLKKFPHIRQRSLLLRSTPARLTKAFMGMLYLQAAGENMDSIVVIKQNFLLDVSAGHFQRYALLLSLPNSLFLVTCNFTVAMFCFYSSSYSSFPHIKIKYPIKESRLTVATDMNEGPSISPLSW